MVARFDALFGSSQTPARGAFTASTFPAGAASVTRAHSFARSRRRECPVSVGLRRLQRPPTWSASFRAQAQRQRSPTSTTAGRRSHARPRESVTYKGANGTTCRVVVYRRTSRPRKGPLYMLMHGGAQRRHRRHSVAGMRSLAKGLVTAGTLTLDRVARLDRFDHEEWPTCRQDTMKRPSGSRPAWIDADRSPLEAAATADICFDDSRRRTVKTWSRTRRGTTAHAYASDGGATKKRYGEYWKTWRLNATAATAAANFKTPTLVITASSTAVRSSRHELFNTLQNRGVREARVLPDENHGC